jgi:hypothetical protein
MTGLLMLMGAALIGEDRSLTCTAFQVGNLDEADTQVHLENDGPESSRVRFDFFVADENGLSRQISSDSPSLEPWASQGIVFRTPALGATVELLSRGRNLRASAAILRDDGAPPESRTSGLCHSPSGPP